VSEIVTAKKASHRIVGSTDHGSSRQLTSTRAGRARIVLTTFGSLGDLHPYLALARGLKERGHDPVIAASAAYRERVEQLGVGFSPVRPDLLDPDAMREEMQHVMDPRHGTEEVLRRWVLPALRESYDDLLVAADGADLIVSHLLTFAAPLVAEQRGLPWVSTALQPMALFSANDPPVYPQTAPLTGLPFLSPWFWRGFRHFLTRLARPWFAPLQALRAEIGLPPDQRVPLLDGHSPWLTLALFSPRFAIAQPDWPPRTVITGFPFFDRPGETTLPPDLKAFLANGDTPLVFALGSAAVETAGAFFSASAEVAQRLGKRAVLVIGDDPRNRAPGLPAGVMAVDYVPYAALFSRAAAIIHQGGIGTTGEAMRAGRPMLVVPFAHDQPDNARRIARLGIGLTIPRERYTAHSATAALERLLGDPLYAQRATAVGAEIRQEHGVDAACDALEELLCGRAPLRHPLADRDG
jgi:MGT family glycosyltransferase